MSQHHLHPLTLDHLQAAMTLPTFDYIESHLRMAPNPRGGLPENRDKPPKEAGVLALCYMEVDGLHIILTRRTDQLRGHSGQISFPGGRCDPEDDGYAGTALRETEEELGILRDDITLLGSLSKVYIPPSHYNVYPQVGYLDTTPFFRPNPHEVAEVFTLRLDDLLDDSLKAHEYRDFRGIRVKIPYYQVKTHKVWGATAVMLSEIEHRLRQTLSA